MDNFTSELACVVQLDCRVGVHEFVVEWGKQLSVTSSGKQNFYFSIYYFNLSFYSSFLTIPLYFSPQLSGAMQWQ